MESHTEQSGTEWSGVEKGSDKWQATQNNGEPHRIKWSGVEKGSDWIWKVTNTPILHKDQLMNL